MTCRAFSPRSARIAVRTSIASAALGLVSLSGTAFADTPASWADAPKHGALAYLLVLLLIPGGIAIVVSVLTVLPSLIRGESLEKGDAWRTGEEWFGGPRQGLEAADHEESEAGKGGASGHW